MYDAESDKEDEQVPVSPRVKKLREDRMHEGLLELWKPEVETVEKFKTEDGRGYGLRAKVDIPKRQIILEYCGELLSSADGRKREEEYEKRGLLSSFQFWFRTPKGVSMCLDAQMSTHISRFINHSRRNANLVTKLIVTADGTPHIMFKTKTNIAAGQELLFDYGDKRKSVVQANPWLKE